jgi:arsenate reductase
MRAKPCNHLEGHEMAIKILHNPRCSKSRETLALLKEKCVDPVVVEYLVDTPTAAELVEIISMLKITPRDLMRKKEAPYKELGLDDPSLTDAQLISAMVAYPVLIERPIVINGGKAALGRPPQAVLEFC